MSINSLGACVLLVAGAASLAPPDAKEIIRKADEKMRGSSSYAEMSMEIIRPEWTRKISMKNWSKGSDYSLLLVTAPARDKGTATLKRKNEIWNWQPSINRSIKLPPSMMMQSWMGSDFTNDDLVKESSIVNDYTHSLLKDSVVSGRRVWVVQLKPRKDAAVVWGRILSYIDQENYNQYLGKYYDEEGALVNTVVMGEVRTMGDRTIPTRMEMIPAGKKGHKTVITYQVLNFNQKLDEPFFSLQNIKNVR